MKKLKTKSYLQQKKILSHISNSTENEGPNSSSVIGHRNGGFYTHF